ncbi:UNKNOWN [Stylonychia lemnae]|uniref:Uncharacterized protein n=1 Tax=Stylonychia lemnae TaxID=5949 RepID=A0A078AAN0_STYLE|nr:UNKNOWN [Stylonychia lemnae]|eukprot:CDW77853.1 UNKNOWN [Stylonychia lemnae]
MKINRLSQNSSNQNILQNQISQLRRLVQAKNDDQKYVKKSNGQKRTSSKVSNNENKENYPMNGPGSQPSNSGMILMENKLQQEELKFKKRVLSNITNVINNQNVSNTPLQQTQKIEFQSNPNAKQPPKSPMNQSTNLATKGLKGSRKLSQEANKSTFDRSKGLMVIPSSFKKEESQQSNITQSDSNRSRSVLQKMINHIQQDPPATPKDFQIKKRKNSLIQIPTVSVVTSPQNIESHEFDIAKQRSQQLSGILDLVKDENGQISQFDTNSTQHINLSKQNSGSATFNQQQIKQMIRRAKNKSYSDVISSRDFNNKSMTQLITNPSHGLSNVPETVEDIHFMRVHANNRQNYLLERFEIPLEASQIWINPKELDNRKKTIEYCGEVSL